MTARSLLALALLAGSLALASGCAKEAEAEHVAPDPNRVLWRQMEMVFSDEAITRIAILRVDDTTSNSANVERQVHQLILDQLTQIADLDVIEADGGFVSRELNASASEASLSIAPELAAKLCAELSVDAFVYATVENGDFDANLKVYQANPGRVIFSKTLQDLELPLGKPGGLPASHKPAEGEIHGDKTVH